MTVFTRFADRVANIVASAYFFTFCVLLIVLWAPSIVLLRDVDLWQLMINTATTIITFLMVAVLQNDQHRFQLATNARLEEIIRCLDRAADPVEDEGQKVP